MQKKEEPSGCISAPAYFGLGVFFWVLVDFGTAGGFRLSYFERYGPSLLVFYLGIPAVFTALVFLFRAGEKILFLATLVAIFVVEVLFTGNPLIAGFPACLIGIPLAIAVYAPLTFFPLWIVRGQIRAHWKIVALLSIVEAAVTFMTVFGSGKTQ